MDRRTEIMIRNSRAFEAFTSEAEGDRLEYRAARLEAQQAMRDWNEQIRSLGAHFTAEGDFLMWRLGGYSQAAERAAFALLPY